MRELENKLEKDKKRQQTLSEGLETIEETESELMESREALQKHVFALETAERDLDECQESLEESSRKLSELEKKLPSKSLKEIKDTIDMCCKYVVLFAFTIYLYHFIEYYVTTGKEINMPDWIVMLFSMVFMYFFRRSPKKEGNNEQVPKISKE